MADRLMSKEEYEQYYGKSPGANVPYKDKEATPPEQPSMAYKVGELAVKIASNHEMAEEIQDILFGGYVTVGGSGRSESVPSATASTTEPSISDRLDRMLARSEECSRVLLAVINRLGK